MRLTRRQRELGFVTEARRRTRRARLAARARWVGHGRPGVPHARRPSLDARHPLHVTLRMLPHVRELRRRAAAGALRPCFVAARDRFGFRVVQFSVQGNHVHLIAEAEDRRALRRGMQGLSIRVAKALNRLAGQKGKVLADRYHARPLATPAAVRAALHYVMTNARRHGLSGARAGAGATDPFSSALHFDGWTPEVRRALDAHRAARCRAASEEPAPVAPARTWLLRVGWRRHGLV